MQKTAKTRGQNEQKIDFWGSFRGCSFGWSLVCRDFVCTGESSKNTTGELADNFFTARKSRYFFIKHRNRRCFSVGRTNRGGERREKGFLENANMARQGRNTGGINERDKAVWRDFDLAGDSRIS